MSLKPRHLKRLASLSAVGAGAMAITADKAEAGTINWVPLATPVVVGFGAGDVKSTSFTFKALSNTFRFGFSRSFGASPGGLAFFRSVAAYGTAVKGATSDFRFATRYFPVPPGSGSVPFLRIFNAGDTWAGSSGAFGSAPVGVRFWAGSGSGTTHKVAGNGPFAHQFAMFEFGPAVAPDYGWIELSYSVSDGFGPACGAGPGCGDPNQLGPELTIEGYAYDTSGSLLAAGAVTSTPEPDTFAATGLAALALGAAGMRRWRKARAA